MDVMGVPIRQWLCVRDGNEFVVCAYDMEDAYHNALMYDGHLLCEYDVDTGRLIFESERDRSS